MSLVGWYTEDGRGNSTQIFHKVNNTLQYLATCEQPQPIEPAWKPSEPVYSFKLFS